MNKPTAVIFDTRTIEGFEGLYQVNKLWRHVK
jgi:hypothetical protein